MDITSLSPLEDHLAGKRKPALQTAIGKGITAPAPGAPNPAAPTGIMAGITAPSQAAPKMPSLAEVRSGYPAIESGPIRIGEPGVSRLRVNSTQQGIAVPGSPPAAPVGQVAPQPAAPVGQSLTSPSAAPMPVHPNAATADPQKMLGNSAKGIDGTGIMAPIKPVDQGGIAAALPGSQVSAPVGQGIMAPIDTRKIGIDSIGTKADPLQKGFTGSGIVAGQQPNSIDVAGGLQSQREAFGQQADPVGIANFKDEVQKATRVNAANGVMPTGEQMKTVGMSNADVINLLSANNRNGQFGKGIEAIQTQQGIDVAASKAKAEMESAKQMGIANLDEKKATAEWHRAQAGALNNKENAITSHVIKDPDSPTGWSYADQSGNIAAQGAPDPAKKGGMGNMGEPLTPENIQRYAETYNRTGEMPSLGRNTADRLAILNAAGDLARSQGLTPGDVAAQHEGFKSDKKSLANITKGMDTVMSFEKGVQSSLTLVDKLSDGFSRGKYPGVNKFSQLISQHVGNPEIKAFRNALTTAMTEYMKVTTAGTGISASELSIGAQARAKELLETSDNGMCQ